MKAITSLITFICDNWTLILICIGAIAGAVAKTIEWRKMSNIEKREAAIEAVRRSMLALVAEAEKAYGSGTGSIKRSQVLEKIFTQYPILAKAISIEDTTAALDIMIDEALVELRELLENNSEFRDLINGYFTTEGIDLATLMAAYDDLDGVEVPEVTSRG